MNDDTATLVLSNDVKPQWLRVVQTLQNATRTKKSPAIVTITVLVDQNGNPVRMGETHADSKATLVFHDLQSQWLNIVRRLQGLARTQQGIALISVSVLVDAENNLYQWTTPEMRCFEPKASADQLLEFFRKHIQDGVFIQWTTATKFFEPRSEQQQFLDFLRLL